MTDPAAIAALPAVKVREMALREAASVAFNACLYGSDGGDPTEAERLVCEEAGNRILALLDKPTAPEVDVARLVEVKPLEWTERADGLQWYGHSPKGLHLSYTALPEVREDHEGPWVSFLDGLWRKFPSLDAAKAAAQADYEARILSALEVQPAPAPVVRIEIRPVSDMPAFGVYVAPLGDFESPAMIGINFASIIAATKEGDVASADVPAFVLETIYHEIGHVLEHWAGVEFSEDRVEALAAQMAGFEHVDMEAPAPVAPEVAALVEAAHVLIEACAPGSPMQAHVIEAIQRSEVELSFWNFLQLLSALAKLEARHD